MASQPVSASPNMDRSSRFEHFKSGVTESELPARHRPHWLGLRRSALLETLLLIALTLVIDAFMQGNRFWDVALHPFMFIVILISTQYGSSEGITAAVLCTIALLLWNLPPQSLDQDWYEYLFVVSYRPVLWFVIALLLGELRLRQVRERENLRDMLDGAMERETFLTKSYKNLQQFKDNLETRIASQMRSGLTVNRAGMALETLEPKDVIVGVGELVESITNANKFSVYLLNDGALETVINKNWTDKDAYNKRITSDTPLYQQVIGRRKLVCVVNEDDRKVLGNQGLIAGALRNTDTGEVIGMLKIEETGFLDLNMTSIETFRMLCDWIGTTYSNARRYQLARDSSIINPDFQLLSNTFLKHQTAFLTDLGKRAQFDVSMLMVRIDNAEELGSDNARKAAIELGQAVQSVLRSIDQAFDYRASGHEFAILLPYTPAENTHVVVNKIRGALDKKLTTMKPAPSFSHEVRTIYNVEDDKKKR